MLGLLAATATAAPIPSDQPTVDGLKARISSATAGEKPRLCLQVAQMRLNEADKLYAAGDLDQAQAALTSCQKKSEIAVRHMTRKLTDLLHTLAQPEQGAIKEAVAHLTRVSDDLLASMFTKGQK